MVAMTGDDSQRTQRVDEQMDELQTPGAGPSGKQNNNSGSMSKRAKTGCITCRVRKKRCDERKPHCASCERLGIECLGYGAKRPNWLRGDDNRKKVRADLKKQILSQRNGRGRDDSTDQDSDPLFDGSGGVGSGYGFASRDDVGPVPVTATTISSGYSSNMDPHQAGPTMPAWQTSSFETTTAISQNTVGVGTLAPAETQAPALWNLADTSTWAMQPAIIGPAPPPSGPSQALTLANGGNETTDADTTFEDLWKTLFGDLSGFTPPAATPPPQLLPQSDPTADLTLLSVFSPSQIGAADNRHVGYLHHYLNVVLPLQYRLGSRQLTDLIGPLAMTRNEVLKSAASLAALHLVAQRTKKPLSLPSSWNDGPDPDPSLDPGPDADDDTVIARSAHRQSIERLRFLTSDDLTSEDVIVSALFAISFHLFSGGTSREWKEVMATSQRCLSAALNGSPEITGTPQLYNFDTPWQRYKPLIAVMIWMDILGSVSQNKASRLLPTYRQLLDQRPIMSTKPQLMMANVMGCDNTTMLALAETVNLSEWKDMAESTGCLSIKELMHRAAAIEKLLAERSWREGLLDGQQPHPDPSGIEEPPENQTMIQVMREVFFNAAKVFLATVIHGPFPRVPEVAAAVQDVTESLHRLDIVQPDDLEINRALVLPITLAGCHCQTTHQQNFFRGRFQRLGNDAAAFGNSRQALRLMEEVWRQRALADPGQKVCWRKAMKDLGWDVGILLI